MFFEQSKLRTDQILRLINLNIPKDRCASKSKTYNRKKTEVEAIGQLTKEKPVKPSKVIGVKTVKELVNNNINSKSEPTPLTTLRAVDTWKGESRFKKKMEEKQLPKMPKTYFSGKAVLNFSSQFRK